MKRLPIVLDNRNFEVEVTPELNYGMVSVAIYEVVRPKWKIFRCTYRGYKTFWVTDYETIAEGVAEMVKRFLEEDKREKEIILKWSQFTK
jgi:hypothetical protein